MALNPEEIDFGDYVGAGLMLAFLIGFVIPVFIISAKIAYHFWLFALNF